VESKPPSGGPEPTLGSAEHSVIRELLLADDMMTIADLIERVAEETGKRVSPGTMSRTLRKLEIRRVRPPARPPRPAAPRPPDPARYKATQRPRRRYGTDLTDAEWAVIEHRFVGPRGRGRPPKHEPRDMLDAMFYVVRTGCAWRMLPTDLPPWTAVYKQFRRWTRNGVIRRVHDDLRRMWRERAGRGSEPTAVIVDSQSARTTEKGGLEVTTRARR
jgi:putative transposase